MLRTILCSSALVLVALATGCCGPIGYGPGCHTVDANCYDCDGTYSPGVVMTPLDGLRNLRRSMVCGGGCGEAYYGEWRSTPPDAHDPCCGGDFVGGAFPCRPFCWPPGILLHSLHNLHNFYGKRFVDGCCDYGCGDEYCEGDCGGEVVEGELGCSTCQTPRNARVNPTRPVNYEQALPLRTARRPGSPPATSRSRR